MPISSFPYLDHLIVGVPELHSGTDLITKLLGATPAPGGRHAGFGTHNALLKIGQSTYLEIIAPDPEQAAHDRPLWMGLDRIREPGLIWWAAKAGNLQHTVPLLQNKGWDPGAILNGSRLLPDGGTLRWQLTDPYRVQEQGVLPFLIDWGHSPHPTHKLPDSSCTLVDFQLLHPEPERIRSYFAALEFELPVHYHPKGAIRAGLETPAGKVYL